MSDPVKDFCQNTQRVGERLNCAMCLYGPDSLYVQAVHKLVAERGGRTQAVAAFAQVLSSLDQWFAPAVQRSTDCGDATISERWRALSALGRAAYAPSDQWGSYLTTAKHSFDVIWRMLTKLGGGTPALNSMATPLTDRDLLRKMEGYLVPWTVGSWMVWDAVCQWNEVAQPVAKETTPVLFGRGNGQVMRLVVEAMPGPSGLVTPNWWKLGLTPFAPKTAAAGSFLGAVQEMLQHAITPGAGIRLRWYLDADESAAWHIGVEGRSVEAAAAIAGLAVCEVHQEASLGKTSGVNLEGTVLDPAIAVTAQVRRVEGGALRDWKLQPVFKATLGSKLNAAKRRGIKEVLVATHQLRDTVTVPEEITVKAAATVGEALELVRLVNRAIRSYKAKIVSDWEAKWKEEETHEDFKNASRQSW